MLYLIEILHQTTTTTLSAIARLMLYLIEILHQTTTPLLLLVLLSRCILSKFYIKPQLVRNYYSYSQVVSYRNSTSNHNPTSLRRLTTLLYLIEILHQTTTPALLLAALVGCILSKFYIKPQLLRPHLHFVLCCILSKFYIKPQHMPFPGFRGGCCILSKFYIKPQHLVIPFFRIIVVSYRNSTSNHN